MKKKHTIVTIIVSLLYITLSSAAVNAEEIYPYQPINNPDITSEFLYLEDINTGTVLYALNAYDRMYPASMTKIMGSILALEYTDNLDESVTITPQMVNGLFEANASVAGFGVGETLTVRDLLYGTLLPSGADAINALAFTVSGSIESFVSLMNEKAIALGMYSTHFTNVTGLHDDNHYSTAYDMALLMKYAVENPDFCEISGTDTYTTSPTAIHPDGIVLQSTLFSNSITDSITGLIGGKTGFTNPAGRCLASHAEINQMHLVLVTGKSTGSGHIQDAATIYNWYSSHYYRKMLLNSGDEISKLNVIDSVDNDVLECFNKSEFSAVLPLDSMITVSTSIPENIYAPVNIGQYLGSYEIYADDQLIYHEDYYADREVKRSFIKYIWRRISDFFIELFQ